MNLEKLSPPESKPNIKLSTRILPIEDKSYKPSTFQSDEEQQKFQKACEDAKEAEKKRKLFWNMLVTQVAKTDYQPPQNRQTQILDVGCGKCEEGIVLSAYFGGNEFDLASNNVKLIGIDIKKEDVDRAITAHQILDFSEQSTKYVLPPNFEFIHGDATKLEQYSQILKQVDVIVIRHPQIFDNKQIWMEIFQKSLI